MNTLICLSFASPILWEIQIHRSPWIWIFTSLFHCILKSIITMNESTEPALFADHQFAGKIVVMVCFTSFLPCIIVSNSLLVLAVYRQYSLRTPTNAIIVSLAISNLLDALVGIPLNVYATVFKFDAWCFNEENTPYYALPLSALSGVSFSHIVALTADRFIAVTKPLRYASLVTFRRIAIVLGCLWPLNI